MTIFDGLFTGLVLGLIISTPAFVVETMRHAKNLPILVDIRTIFGKTISERHVLTVSTLLHLAVAMIYGGAYPLLVSLDLFPSYQLIYIVSYTAIFYLVFGFIVSPALGLGICGRREGKLVWLEMMVSCAIYAITFWYASTKFFLA